MPASVRKFAWIDQYGAIVWATNRTELKRKVGPGRVSKTYRDLPDGTVESVGYAIGHRWFERFEAAPIGKGYGSPSQ